jgi:hypothetical protein
MAGEDVDLPHGYEGWTAPEDQSDEDLLEQYVRDCRLATAAIDHLSLDADPEWWFEGGGDAPLDEERAGRSRRVHALVVPSRPSTRG